MKTLRLLLVLPLLLLFMVFGLLLGLDNSQFVPIVLLDWTTPALPFIVWLLLALVLGVLIGFLLGGGVSVRHRLARRRAERAVSTRSLANAQVQESETDLTGNSALERAPATAQDPADGSQVSPSKNA